jgi:hypothetical protein
MRIKLKKIIYDKLGLNDEIEHKYLNIIFIYYIFYLVKYQIVFRLTQ